MATVVDALVVSLRLDTTQFQKAAAEAGKTLDGFSDKTTNLGLNVQKQGEEMSDVFAALRNQAMGFLAVLMGGRALQQFAGYTMQAASAVGYLARSTGISTQELTAWQGAVKQFGGGTAEEASSALSNMAMEFEKLKLGGQSSLTPFFNFLHVGLNNASGGFKSMTEMLVEASAALSKMTPARANLLMSQYGGMPAGMRNLLLQGPEAVNRALSEQQAAGLTTEAQAKNFQALNSAIIALQISAETAAREGLDKIAPAVTRALNQIDGEVKKFRLGQGDAAMVVKAIKDAMDFSLSKFLRESVKPAATGADLGGLYPGGLWENFKRNAATVTRFFFGGRPAAGGGDGGGTDGGAGGGGGNIAPPASGSAAHGVMEQTRAFWKSKGFSDVQVAGILAGGPAAESGFNPALPGDRDTAGNPTSYGLYQHHATRKDALFARFGTTSPTVDQQNQFAWEELQARPWLLSGLRGSRSEQEAARLWTTGFERPKYANTRAEERAASASRFLPRAGPAIPPPIDPALLGSGPLGAAGTTTSSTTNTTTVGPVTVDARGARDPAAVGQAVRQALSGAAPAVANTAYGAR